MYTTIGPEALGIRGLTLSEALALTRDSGFAGLCAPMGTIADAVDARGIAAVREEFAQAGVRPAHWNLPVAWRDDEKYDADMRELPRFAAIARDLGLTRSVTYMPSGSDERAFQDNLDWHVSRLRPIAEILRDEGIRFGVEYIGPKTYRDGFRHEFIYTLAGLMNLLTAINVDNVGVMLDSWHLFASGGSLADIEQLTNEDIVVVHVNDAPAGIPWDEQIDVVRALPMDTGVIDLAGFMRALQQLGYDGPVMPEPFNQRVTDLAAENPLAAAREASRSMQALWNVSELEA